MELTIGSSTYQVEQLDGSRIADRNGYDLCPAYRLTGKRGAELWACRYQNHPERLFTWNARTSTMVFTSDLTDASGQLAVC